MEKGQGRTVTVRLEEQSRRFARDKNRSVNGQISMQTVQTQTRIIVSAENLNGSGTKYNLFFIGRKDGSSVYKMIGDIVPDGKGMAEFHTVLDTANVDGEGTALSCFYIFMIAAAGIPLQPVLKGDMIARSQDQQQELHTERKREYNGYYADYVRQMTCRLIEKQTCYRDIQPFGSRWLAGNWRRVTDMAEFPVASAGAQKQISKYGHFIFAYEGDTFLLAVPGRHIDEDWPDKGASGFMLWQSIRNSQEYGYWCMVIDWKTGIITEIS